MEYRTLFHFSLYSFFQISFFAYQLEVDVETNLSGSFFYPTKGYGSNKNVQAEIYFVHTGRYPILNFHFNIRYILKIPTINLLYERKKRNRECIFIIKSE